MCTKFMPKVLKTGSKLSGSSYQTTKQKKRILFDSPFESVYPVKAGQTALWLYIIAFIIPKLREHLQPPEYFCYEHVRKMQE